MNTFSKWSTLQNNVIKKKENEMSLFSVLLSGLPAQSVSPFRTIGLFDFQRILNRKWLRGLSRDMNGEKKSLFNSTNAQ